MRERDFFTPSNPFEKEPVTIDMDHASLLRKIVMTGFAGVTDTKSKKAWLVDGLMSKRRFERINFFHKDFQGSGRDLLQRLHINTKEEYADFVSKIFPEERGVALMVEARGADVDRIRQVRLKYIEGLVDPPSVVDDARHLISESRPEDAGKEEGVLEGMRAVFGSQESFSPEEDAQDPFLRESIKSAYEQLPLLERDILIEHSVHGVSYLDLARIHDLAFSDVQKIYTASLKALKDGIQRSPGRPRILRAKDSGSDRTTPMEQVMRRERGLSWERLKRLERFLERAFVLYIRIEPTETQKGIVQKHVRQFMRSCSTRQQKFLDAFYIQQQPCDALLQSGKFSLSEDKKIEYLLQQAILSLKEEMGMHDPGSV